MKMRCLLALLKVGDVGMYPTLLIWCEIGEMVF